MCADSKDESARTMLCTMIETALETREYRVHRVGAWLTWQRHSRHERDVPVANGHKTGLTAANMYWKRADKIANRIKCTCRQHRVNLTRNKQKTVWKGRKI